MALKLFIRTDATVIQDALKLTRPVFVQKYRDTASTEKVLEEAYHQLRVHHLKTTSAPPKDLPAHLKQALDPTIGDDDDAIVVTDNSPAPEDNTISKVTIQKRDVAPGLHAVLSPETKKAAETATPIEPAKIETTSPSESKGKKERILELLADGKKPGEVVRLLALEGLAVSNAYVNKLSKI